MIGPQLIYCATPSRLIMHTNAIMDFVTLRGHAPFHPFVALPYERFEGNPVIGRARSMAYCKRAVEMCDQFWMFGVSEGTLDEVVEAFELGKEVELHLADWAPGDREWRRKYDELKLAYGDPLKDLLKHLK